MGLRTVISPKKLITLLQSNNVILTRSLKDRFNCIDINEFEYVTAFFDRDDSIRQSESEIYLHKPSGIFLEMKVYYVNSEVIQISYIQVKQIPVNTFVYYKIIPKDRKCISDLWLDVKDGIISKTK